MGSAGGVLGAVPGMIGMLVGIFFVIVVQVGRAAVDTAQMTGKLLDISEQQLQLSKAAQNRSLANQPEAMQRRTSGSGHDQTRLTGVPTLSSEGLVADAVGETSNRIQPTSNAGFVEHMGKQIRSDGHAFFLGNHRFQSLEKAKRHIEATTMIAER